NFIRRRILSGVRRPCRRSRTAAAWPPHSTYNPPMITTALLASVIAIKAGTLIDGRGDTPKHNQVIVIQDNRIVAVGGDVAVPAGARVIDLSNATVLPGLIDTHTHMFLQGEDPAEGGYDVQLLKYGAAYRAARATVSA